MHEILHLPNNSLWFIVLIILSFLGVTILFPWESPSIFIATVGIAGGILLPHL